MAMLPKQLLREADVLFLTRCYRSLSSKIGRNTHSNLTAVGNRCRMRCLCEVDVPRKALHLVRHTSRFSTPVANVATASNAVCKRQLSADSDDDIPWFMEKPTEILEESQHELETDLGPRQPKERDAKKISSNVTPSDKKNIISGRTMPRIHKLTKKQLLGRIQNRGIIYDDGHIVAINKLAGFPVQAKTPEEVSLNSLLPELGAALGAPELSIIKPLDWHLSGVVLLARTPEARAEVLNIMKPAKAHRIFYRKYWGIVIGTLDPLEGEIKCHLTQQQIGDHTMTVPVLDPPTKGAIRRKEARNCLTKYKVLSKGDGYALVQLEPLQMFVDQLQVHLTTRLCTVLGDHVYSSRVGSVAGIPALMEPSNVGPRTQRVPKDILQKMNLRLIQMHRVPLHLHCGEMVLPGYRGKDVRITAPLPKHFVWTLQLLGLKDPSQET